MQVSEELEGFRLSPQQRRVLQFQPTAGQSPFLSRCRAVVSGVDDLDVWRMAVRALRANVLFPAAINESGFRMVTIASCPTVTCWPFEYWA